MEYLATDPLEVKDVTPRTPHKTGGNLGLRSKLSQAAFAERFCLPIGTIRDWEQARRSPDRAAVVLLSIIDRNPKVVAETLAAR